MSSLPNSKSSFLRVAQGCGALALAGAMVLPMTPALAQNATPAADAAVAAATPQAAHQVAAATPTLDVSLPNGYNYDGVNVFLVTTEGGTVHVKGAGYTKEWRAQHGTVALYIAPRTTRLPATRFRLRRCCALWRVRTSPLPMTALLRLT